MTSDSSIEVDGWHMVGTGILSIAMAGGLLFPEPVPVDPPVAVSLFVSLAGFGLLMLIGGIREVRSR